VTPFLLLSFLDAPVGHLRPFFYFFFFFFLCYRAACPLVFLPLQPVFFLPPSLSSFFSFPFPSQITTVRWADLRVLTLPCFDSPPLSESGRCGSVPSTVPPPRILLAKMCLASPTFVIPLLSSPLLFFLPFPLFRFSRLFFRVRAQTQARTVVLFRLF